MTVEIIKYGYDDTGLKADNKAQLEEHKVTRDMTFILPRGGCYFRGSLEVIDLSTNTPLKEGFDYRVGNMYQEATLDVGQGIWGTIFFERELEMTIGINVQYIGGKYSVDTKGIGELLSQINEHGDKILWDDIIKPDIGVAPTEHRHNTMTDLMGTQELVKAIDRIAEIMLEGRQAGTKEAVSSIDTKYIEERLSVIVDQHSSGNLVLTEKHFDGQHLILSGAGSPTTITIPAGLRVDKPLDIYSVGSTKILSASSDTVIIAKDWTPSGLDCVAKSVTRITPVDAMTYLISY